MSSRTGELDIGPTGRVVVTPIATFVLSGAGSHMSPLLLYPFASPW